MTLFTVKALHRQPGYHQLLFIAEKYQYPHHKPKPCKANRELPVRLTGKLPVSQFSQGKIFFITGNPLLIAGILFRLQGFPCKTLYFPVRDCRVVVAKNNAAFIII